MKPYTHLGMTPAHGLFSIQDRSRRLRSLSIRVISVVVLLMVSGCVPPPNRATRTTTPYRHHEPNIRPNRATQRELSDEEKDKLFRDFERWRAAKKQVGLQAVQQGQPARGIGGVEVPDE
jgi:hypothetical protein